MKKEIHLLIMVALLTIFLIFKNANKIQKSASEWVLNKYGELRIVKFIAFMIPILMCSYFYLNLNYSKQSSFNNSIFTFFMYLFLGLLIFFINEFYQLKEDLLLPSGIKVNTLKLFRHLKNENIVNGKFTDFCNFLSQSNQPKKPRLTWNDYDSNRFIYKKILSLCIICFLEPDKKYIDLKTNYYQLKLEPYFSKPDLSTLNISDDNISKFRITDDKNYNFIKSIIDKSTVNN